MKGFLQMMDRFKVVEGIIIIIVALIVPRTHGIAELAELVIAASLCIALYFWWRRKGRFAHRR
jgi:hypothetical protein